MASAIEAAIGTSAHNDFQLAFRRLRERQVVKAFLVVLLQGGNPRVLHQPDDGDGGLSFWKFNLLTQWILSGPVVASQGFVHDGDLLCFGLIGSK